MKFTRGAVSLVCPRDIGERSYKETSSFSQDILKYPHSLLLTLKYPRCIKSNNGYFSESLAFQLKNRPLAYH